MSENDELKEAPAETWIGIARYIRYDLMDAIVTELEARIEQRDKRIAELEEFIGLVWDYLEEEESPFENNEALVSSINQLMDRPDVPKVV